MELDEEHWLTCSDPAAMLRLLLRSPWLSDRKARLFAVACCHRIWSLLSDEKSRKAVEVAERFAEGLANSEDMEGAATDASPAYPGVSVRDYAGQVAGWVACASDSTLAAEDAADWSARAVASQHVERTPLWLASFNGEQAAQAELLRCIFGNPLGLWIPSLDPERNPTALALATGIYDERAFERMPILADALEEAGCTDGVILEHCRGPGPHVRGCWVVDLVLGKQ